MLCYLLQFLQDPKWSSAAVKSFKTDIILPFDVILMLELLQHNNTLYYLHYHCCLVFSSYSNKIKHLNFCLSVTDENFMINNKIRNSLWEKCLQNKSRLKKRILVAVSSIKAIYLKTKYYYRIKDVIYKTIFILTMLHHIILIN